MKSVIRFTAKIEVPEFPKLKINLDGNIIALFSAPKEGVVIHSDNPYNAVGQYSKDWAEDQFKDFEDTIVLNN